MLHTICAKASEANVCVSCDTVVDSCYGVDSVVTTSDQVMLLCVHIFLFYFNYKAYKIYRSACNRANS